MSDRSWDDFSKRVSAYGMGIANVPVDIVRYAGLGANSLFEWTGLRSEEDARYAAQAIKDFTDNLPFLPQEVNDYRNWLKQEAPENFSLGEVAGGAITGSAIGQKLPYLLQKGNPLIRAIQANPAAVAAALSAMKEWGVEPAMEAAFTPTKPDKNNE